MPPMSAVNPPDWPNYTGARDEWALYSFPNHMPKPDAPIDVPLPFDRTNGNRNFTQLFGNSKEASDRVHKAINFVSTDSLRSPVKVPYWPSKLEVKLGMELTNYPEVHDLLEEMIGPRPHPLRAYITSNSSRNILKGEGYAGLVYAGVWDKHWWPIAEVVLWNPDGVIFRRVVPSRHLYSDIRAGASFTEQVIHEQIRRTKWS